MSLIGPYAQKRRISAKRPEPTLTGDPAWYKDAVIYELRVRSFYDSNGDGIGDFQGLTEKLDYLQDLGITALWLLPFYPSPLRDDGYDISDYNDVHPEVGTLDDFKRFLDEAHRRGLKVITELVINHTSDQHPWFQRARRAPPGSPERDFYVWSDTPEKYKDARIIFKDFETSNWSWDPVARAYFWHRFYAHQPDLNFDNPAVQEAVFEALDFWLGMGVDGLRLDAIPYLYEREGTNCENLQETHAFLRRLRKHVDERFHGRMLLAEANQWPEDSVAYFGEDDECHMAFHFPIMPRLFMSIHLEDRFPILDILAQTPHIPEKSQWALFLRNHDELTLEMVTDEERDYMYRAYAHEPTMRINLGIRRRLAPLLRNDRRNIELMNGLLFSLPGTPVLYYGDEIGMGDNVYLGDRNGVRTPMQWSSDRNAGFSRVNPQRLILPVIIDPEYHYESINVEAQQNNTNSLLWWTKRMIALRKRFSAFGRGSIEFLRPDNPRVLAFIRQLGDEAILVVANLSRFVQYAEIDLERFKGRVPVELFGHSEFPAVGDAPYMLTLSGHGFYWFSLEAPRGGAEEARVSGYHPPSIEVAGSWDAVLKAQHRGRLIDAITAYLELHGWIDETGRRLQGVQILDVVPTDDGGLFLATDGGAPPPALLLVVAVDYREGESDRILLPLAFESDERAGELRARSPHAVVAHLRIPRDGGATSGLLYDALADNPSCHALLEAVLVRGRLRGAQGAVVASTSLQLGGVAALPEETARAIRAEHRNSAVMLGNPVFLSVCRKLDEGTSPDLEIARFLAGRPPIAAAPPLAGAIEYRPARGEPMTLAVLRRYEPTEGDAHAFTHDELRRYFERILTREREASKVALPLRPLLARVEQEAPAEVTDVMGTYLDAAELLGRRVAELHLALAADAESPAFMPEPYSSFDQRSTYQTMRNLAGRVLRSVRLSIKGAPEAVASEATALIEREGDVLRRFGALMNRRLTAHRTRHHGSLTLRKILYTGKDFRIASFEGDTSRPLSDRRRKASPLRDVASLLRSFQNAALLALGEESVVRREDRERATPWAHLWYRWVWAAFLKGYFAVAGGASFLPKDASESEILIDTFMLERAFGELGWELDHPSERIVLRLRQIRLHLDTELLK